MNIIPERDLYRLIMRSKLPTAQAFEEKVVGEVLPAIRRTGGNTLPAILAPSAEQEELPLSYSNSNTANTVTTAKNLIPFTFEGTEVRVLEQSGEPWWVLADVCKVLEIANAGNASARLDADEKTTIRNMDSQAGSGAQAYTIINESGLWSLVLTSRKPAAKRFKKWVTAEVLPSIRRTGGYMTASPDESSEAQRPDSGTAQTSTRCVSDNHPNRTPSNIGTMHLTEIALSSFS